MKVRFLPRAPNSLKKEKIYQLSVKKREVQYLSEREEKNILLGKGAQAVFRNSKTTGGMNQSESGA